MGDSGGAGRSRRVSDWPETTRLKRSAGVGGRAGRKVSSRKAQHWGPSLPLRRTPPPKRQLLPLCVCVCV